MESPMQEFYRDKVVFLTGATGVLGELFVEKLLRCNVKRLLILLRPKREKQPQQRIEEICSSAPFQRLQVLDAKFADRLTIIEGDVSRLDLGLSGADVAALNDSVEICIHAAANVRFDCPLERIVLENVRGTRELLRLALGFRKLQMFVYMSTAYSHSHAWNTRTQERFYPAPMDPEAAIRLAERVEAGGESAKQELATLTDKLISPWPNTYSFSKAVAEELIRRSANLLPIVMVRPSIVVGTHEDPIAGYCTNYFGLNGVLCANAAGLSRIMFGEPRNVANIVCADFVVNGTLAIVWVQASKRAQKNASPVYNLNSGHSELTWGQITETCKIEYRKFPWINSPYIALPNFTMCPYMMVYYQVVYQLLPGLLFDSGLWLAGSKNRLLPMYRKILLFMALIKFFMSTQWHFAADNIQDVFNRMTPFDRQYFPVGAERLDFPAFSQPYCMALRTYIARETDDTIPAARTKYARISRLHSLVLVLYYTAIAGFFYAALRLSGWLSIFAIQ